jgi:predicted nucleotidyltransferase
MESAPLEILHRHRTELKSFGVKSLALFGSAVRGEAKPTSDIDILVEFNKPIGLFSFIRLQHRLSEILGRQVDLVTQEALKPQLRDHILEEISHAGQGLEV